jgi:Rps23 Pro-64 3,4-dihydroxylase Tpa1-like proline 4-hydroxylase
MNLRDWIAPAYVRSRTAATLRKRYASNAPFAHLQLTNFFRADKLARVRTALLKERFFEQEADLFSFEQTHDVKKSSNKTLRAFRDFLQSRTFLTWLSYVTGENLAHEIDISGFIYDDTDHLLPHDDKLEGRKIAFVVNLSKQWIAKNGGQLDLFKHNRVAKSYVPAWNSFVIFTVKPGTTYHRVREVVANKQRLTLAGWVHG